MKKRSFFLFVCCVLGAHVAFSQPKGRIDIPDVEPYKTLKCDFHMHTVFSDGQVWPTVRTREAFLEGLDAISITDHIEHIPNINKGYIVADHNTPYKIAASSAKSNDVLLIRGSEITRSMPPGHFNAIFLKDCNPLDTPQYMDAFKAAKEQNAFIFWNHPGWFRQAPNRTVWLPEHTKLYEAGLMHGIEVVNSAWYSPEAHAWALEKNLTILGNSDSHNPMAYEEYFMDAGHRPMTLVFAADKSTKSIREALDARRTAVYFGDRIIGAEEWVRNVFDACLKVENIVRKPETATVYVRNQSGLTLRLVRRVEQDGLIYVREKVILPYAKSSFLVRFVEPQSGMVTIHFDVDNFLIGPNKPMHWTVDIQP